MPHCTQQSAVASHCRETRRRRHIVFTTMGSLGDLYPYMAVALELASRGQRVAIATSHCYRTRIEKLGIEFRPLRPEVPDLDFDRERLVRIMNRSTGPRYIIRDLVMSALPDSYEDTLAAAQGADLLVSHVLTYATGLVAQQKQIPWASTLLQPMGFFSAHDPPVLPQLPALARLRFLGPQFHRCLFGLARWSCRSWTKPWHDLRARIGLPPTTDNPLFEGMHSPQLVLAMFSRHFAREQPDWPAQTVISGFPFFQNENSGQLSARMRQFLDAAPAPILFTLGSSGALVGGNFFQQSAAAAQMLGHRAILITGKDPANRPAALPDGVDAFEYEPFPELLPRCAAIVHPGGIGTTALAMRLGVPQLLIPLAHDQFDNAARAQRLGAARVLRRRAYHPHRIAAKLRHLLDQPGYAQRITKIQEKLATENGVTSAADALEDLLITATQTQPSARKLSR